MGTYISLFFSLAGVVLVLILTYYGSRWMVKRYFFTARNRHIRIIDRAMIGRDRYILVVNICGGRYIIGVSGQQITLIKEIGESEEDEETAETAEDFIGNFNTILKDRLKKLKSRFISDGEKH